MGGMSSRTQWPFECWDRKSDKLGTGLLAFKHLKQVNMEQKLKVGINTIRCFGRASQSKNSEDGFTKMNYMRDWLKLQ